MTDVEATPTTRWSRTPPLRLGLVQFAPRKGDVAGNLRSVAALVEEHAGTCDLLVFPEAALTGYHLQGAVESLARTVDEVAAGLGTPPDGAPDVLLGFYERRGSHLHNAAAHFEPGPGGFRALHVHRKVFLPTYGIFDEARFVAPGSEVAAYETRFGRLGALVCEDALHSLAPTILALDGAQLLLTVSAAPVRDPSPEGRPGSLARWDHAMAGAAGEHGVFAALTHPVGSEGGILFPGGAVLADPRGRIVARGPLFEEEVVRAAVDPREVGRVRARASMLADLRATLPALGPQLDRLRPGAGGASWSGEAEGRLQGREGPPGTGEDGAGDPAGETWATGSGPRPDDPSPLEVDPALVERLLVRFLGDEFAQRGFERAVVGVSGGLDSTVALVLAARALGPGNVHAFSMPDAPSRPDSGEHAALAARTAGVELRTVPVSPMVEAYAGEAEPELPPARRGNVAARMRALVLFDQAAKHGALPVGTGTKSERLLGYFTWHGDDSPPINPLGDLFKTQVVALARHLGVPEEILEKPPSADLVAGVDDADELGVTYAEADPILHWILLGFAPGELVERGFRREAVERVSALLESTHWKRNPATTAILSETSIGAYYLRPVDLQRPGG